MIFRALGYAFASLFVVMLVAVGGIVGIYYEYGRDLPNHAQLADYQPDVVTRVHAGDGRLIREYATENRVFVPIEAVPEIVKRAFISAEDQNFMTHPGIDPIGILRAAATNLRNLGAGRRPVGASTITQQVAQNFLLTKEVSIRRKIREAILALRIEAAMTKDDILELYLNQIYLGNGSYGVAAAAMSYFGKPLSDLTVAEAAFLAALPKAPGNYQPLRNPEAALARRNYVLGRMRDDGVIDAATATRAASEAIRVVRAHTVAPVRAAYFSEEVRREIVAQYGNDALYRGGLSIRTSLDPRLQGFADAALREGLIAYDRRHGWRGATAKLADLDDWAADLAARGDLATLDGWRIAVVLRLTEDAAEIGFADGARGVVPMAEMAWARPQLRGQHVGQAPHRPSDVVAAGDIIHVEALAPGEGEDESVGSGPARFALRQIPEINGAIIALDPHTGRVLAMSGGLEFRLSEFNRATQAERQPGSAFKPFVYMAALDSGLTPNTSILDAPFVIDQGPGLGKWKPANYTREFYGPTPMRIGVENSRNLMTVRLAQTIGIERVAEYARRFGVIDNMPLQLSMAIGAGETTLLRMVTAYAMIVNGGKRIDPSFIDRIQDRHGRTIARHDTRQCNACQNVAWTGQAPPRLPDDRARVVDAATAYQMVSMLEGVVKRGTGRRLRDLGVPIAGKTGTTNDNRDAWFVGFTPDLAVGVFTGFDEPRSLGPRETGSRVALPVFKGFMKRALEGVPPIPFRVPEGIRLVRIFRDTGEVAPPGAPGTILEAFKTGTNPRDAGPLIDGGYRPPGTSATAASGIY